MKKNQMKKLFAMLLVLVLAAAFPAIAYADEAPLTALEDTACEACDPAQLSSDELLTELPDWLSALIFAEEGTAHARSLRPIPPTFTGGSPYMIAASGAPGYAPSLYEPYTVTKTKTYYDKNGAAAYALILSAVFVDTNAGATCLKTNAESRIYSGSWRITPGEPTVNGRMVTAAFTVQQLFTGITVRSETVNVTLFSDERTGTGFMSGDVNGDGSVTTADARGALRIAVELEPETEYNLRVADLTGDGAVTPADARGILRMAVGLYQF